jgi:tetratricopeptide (TPR) repeat protein
MPARETWNRASWAFTVQAVTVGAVVLLLPAGPRAADVQQASALRARAFTAVYNLDYPEAVKLLDAAIAHDPDNPANERARATALWLQIVFARGSVTVDQYLGSFRRSDVDLDKPPADEAALFAHHAGRALQLSERSLARRPDDVQALYDVGASVGLLASYSATVDGKVLSAFREARRAFDAHEKVLALDPRRKDAGLIVGTYRYIVSTLNLPMRWMAYVVGFGGDRALGIRMIEEAARYPSDIQTDANVALLLLYNREGRYADAMAVTRTLMARYPRNRLFWLEAGATEIRAGRYAEAERLLSEGVSRLPDDPRPRAFGEEALWYYKRGLARVARRNTAGAAADLERARGVPAREWVKARIELERGKLADLEGRRDAAVQAYRQAARLAEASNDGPTEKAATRFLETAYR